MIRFFPAKSRIIFGNGRNTSPNIPLIDEILQNFRPRGVAQLAQSLGLDLADALARDVKLCTHLLQCMHFSVLQTVAQTQDLFLARRERFQNARKLFAQHGKRRGIRRLRGILILNEIPQMAVVLLAHRRLQ